MSTEIQPFTFPTTGQPVRKVNIDGEVTHAERVLAGRAGALKSWAFTADRSKRTAPARAAKWAKYLQQVDPEGVLPVDERERRADQLHRAAMTEMSRLAVAARRKNAAKP